MQNEPLENDQPINSKIRKINRRNEEEWRSRWAQIEAGGNGLMQFAHQAAERDEQRIRTLNLSPISTVRALQSFEYFALGHLSLVSKLRSELGRKGGKARKTDRLSATIAAIVAREPSISEKALLARIIRISREPDSWITDVTDRTIEFENNDRSVKYVRISSLKDRLTRAKKKSR